MTALEQIIKEAKRLRRKYPHRFKHLQNPWRDGYMAQASAIYAKKHKGRSPVGKKKRVSNVETKSKSHVDKNRMTTNIQIGSAFQNNKVLQHLNDETRKLSDAEIRLIRMKQDRKEAAKGAAKNFFNKAVRDQQRYIRTIHQNISRLKTHLK